MFNNLSGFNFVLIAGGTLTWLVFVLTMAKLSKFYYQFTVFRRDVETNLTGMGSNLKTMQTFFSEIVIEQRRANKLMVELIDVIKKQESGIDISYEGSGGAAAPPPERPDIPAPPPSAPSKQQEVQRFVFEEPRTPGEAPRLKPVQGD